METLIHLDTHVVVWLYAGAVERFPQRVQGYLENESLAISPMVVLELQYLFEIQRITQPGQMVFDDLQQRVHLQLAETPFASIIQAASQLHWTRDPFDRLIAGQALAENVPLLTADRTLLENLPVARWDEDLERKT